ncbi:MAG: hypothetical protein GX886_00200, partial [Comamonadaceae bacterium]|nr:hypothetical protein [Comamonadaceae bacterium]
MGEFFGSMAQRVGMTPEQLFEKYRLRTVAESVTGGQWLDGEQSAQPTPAALPQFQVGDRVLHNGVEETIAVVQQHPTSKHRAVVSFSTDPSKFVFADDVQAFTKELPQRNVFGVNMADLALPLDELVARHVNVPISSMTPADPTGMPLGSIRVAPYGEADQRYVDVLREVPVDSLLIAEPEDNIRRSPEYQQYVEWAREGREAPAIQVNENERGELVSANRRRALAAKEAGLQTVKAWVSPINPQTGDPLKYGDLRTYNQSAQRGPRASFNPATNTIALLQAADLSSFLHESGHFFLEVMTDMAASVQTYDADQLTEGERSMLRDVQALMQWFGLRDLNEWAALDFEEKRAYHEKFAESFELYLTEGNAPSIELQPLFGRFRAWLLNVYRSIKDFLARNPAAGALSDDVRRVFDRMLATDQAIKTAEQARSLMPLFASAQQAGMTEEEFAAYQALGQDATEAAQEDLGTRGVRDMQWLAGARSRALKRLQKEAAALREQMEMEARREV